MKQSQLAAVIKLMVLVCLINFNGEVLIAQDVGLTNRPRLTGGNKTTTKKNPPTQPRTRVVYTPVYKTIEKKPTGLSITTLPNADISLELVGSKIKETKKADAKGVFTFESLKAGDYKLITSLKGYYQEESIIKIVYQKVLTIPIVLKRQTYPLSIRTNVDKGEVRFAPVEVLEENADGTFKVRETGVYCYVPIADRTALIKELPEGSYAIDVRSSEPEYKPELVLVEIPEDIPEVKPDDKNADRSFKINLENRQSTDTFNQILTRDAWELPENWKIDEKGLKADGAGVALPKSKTYRYYKDFEMQSTVRLMDNTSVGFVVRALDNKNYYLIRLTGSAAEEKYRITGFLVKDGKPERIMENPIPFLADIISDQKYFTVIIKGRGNIFEVFVEDSKTGNSYPLGNITYQSNNFPIGAAGLGVTEKAGFEVGLFTVCNEVCK